jgi:AbrB family looped-hinge helix DNA binding protein
MQKTVKITRKGQLTVPRTVRDLLGSNIVEIEVLEGKVVLKPVRSVAGTLGKYARHYFPVSEVRQKVWTEVIRAKKDTAS